MPFAQALLEFVTNSAENWDSRELLAKVVWRTRGAKRIVRAIRHAFLSKNEAEAILEYLGLMPHEGTTTRLSLFREVLRGGTIFEQVDAVDAIAMAEGNARVRRTLIGLVEDTAAPLEVRDRATEMLHLFSSRTAAEACIRALKDPAPSIRFWAAYSLGQISSWNSDYRIEATAALKRMLNDEAVAPGWWSVGREAQAMIIGLRNLPRERERLQKEIQTIQDDPCAAIEDKRWAEHYEDREWR
ncbi:MAG: HEAT repeat domain-containing protein [Bryobacteraceae bacterium]